MCISFPSHWFGAHSRLPTNYKPWQPPPGIGNYYFHQNKEWRGIPMMEENTDEPPSRHRVSYILFLCADNTLFWAKSQWKGWNHLPVTTVPYKCSYTVLRCGKRGKAKDPGEKKPQHQIKFDIKNIYFLPVLRHRDFSFYLLIWHLGHMANLGQFRICSDTVTAGRYYVNHF